MPPFKTPAVTLACMALLAVIAPAAFGKDTIYWGNFDNSTISFANLDGSGGGGQLNTTGATLAKPDGLALDPPTGTLFWANFTGTTLGYASLTGSGGGTLNTSGVMAAVPNGPATLPGARKIYWANNGNNSIAFANIGGGGGGLLNTAG